MIFFRIVLLLFIFVNMSCQSSENNDETTSSEDMNQTENENKSEPESEPEVNSGSKAKITSVSFSGTPNNYNFSVGISSPDKGCNQYANWWEVITEEGVLIYRRILAHSHINEQPFIRSGGVVAITANQVVIVRAHMNTSGYGIVAFKGTIADGFEAVTLEADFAKDLAVQDPLPSSCAF